MDNNFQLLFECYISGQMTEKQWQIHLQEDEGLKEWYDAFLVEKGTMLREKLHRL